MQKTSRIITALFYLGILLTGRNSMSYSCPEFSKEEIDLTIEDLKQKKYSASELDICQKESYKLFSRLVEINPAYLKYASQKIRSDEIFIKNFIRSNPEILNYISFNLKSDPLFFKMAIKIHEKVLKYANYDLVDNFDFMEEMIDLDYKNFIYASLRLQDNRDFVLMAVKKDGRTLEYASDRLKKDKLLVKHAKKTYALIDNDLSNDFIYGNKANKKNSQNYDFLRNAEIFLMDNYSGIKIGPEGSRGYRIVNKAKILNRDPVLDRKDFFKWKSSWVGNKRSNAILTTGEIKELGWKIDLRNHPNLIKTIESYLQKQLIDQNTIDSMTLVSMWRIHEEPEVVVFKMYLLRDGKNIYYDKKLNNIFYITGVAYGNKTSKPNQDNQDQKKVKESSISNEIERIKSETLEGENQNKILNDEKTLDPKTNPSEPEKSDLKEDDSKEQKIEDKEDSENPLDEDKKDKNSEKEENIKKFDNNIIDQESWDLTIIDSSFDVDLENNIIIKNGHKEYEFWDIYPNKSDRFSNLIFKVTDKNEEYFEIFSKQEDNIYRFVFRGGGYVFD